MKDKKQQDQRNALTEFATLYFTPDHDDVSGVAPPLLQRTPSHLRDGEVLSFELDGNTFDIFPMYVTYEAALHVATRLLDALPQESHIETAYELRQMLWARLESEYVQGTRPTEVNLGAVVEMLHTELTQPATKWEYTADFGFGDPNVPVAINIAGAAPLQLISATRDDGRTVLRVRGSVLAHTQEGALFAVEQRVLEAVGAALVVGVLRHTRKLEAEPTIFVSLGVSMAFTHATQAVLARCGAQIPRELLELERKALTNGDVERAIRRHLALVHRVLGNTHGRADAVRNACRVAALSLATLDDGIALTLAFSVLEGLLLDSEQTENVLARLTEAVAHALGQDDAERRRLRAEVKKLYNQRSIFVHTGRVQEFARARRYATELMLAVLRREIAMLDAGEHS